MVKTPAIRGFPNCFAIDNDGASSKPVRIRRIDALREVWGAFPTKLVQLSRCEFKRLQAGRDCRLVELYEFPLQCNVPGDGPPSQNGQPFQRQSVI